MGVGGVADQSNAQIMLHLNKFPALLAACGLEHHTSAFEAESYTLQSLLGAMKQGDEAAMRDLRELKLGLGECRKLIKEATKIRGSLVR